MAATRRRAPSLYLFLENQDSEGCSPALKTGAGEEVAVFTSSWGLALGSGTRTAAADACLARGLTAFDSCAFAVARAGDAAGIFALGLLAAAAEARAAAANACPSGLRAGAGRAPVGIVCFNWPRHFFSSHSTQSSRPPEMGNPQASHFRNPRSTGGTWLSSPWAACPSVACSAADQNSDFGGVAVCGSLAVADGVATEVFPPGAPITS